MLRGILGVSAVWGWPLDVVTLPAPERAGECRGARASGLQRKVTDCSIRLQPVARLTSNILFRRLFLQVTLRQRRWCIELDSCIGPEFAIHAELDIVLHQKAPIVARPQLSLQRQYKIA